MLTTAQFELIKSHLNKHPIGCPCCGSREWDAIGLGEIELPPSILGEPTAHAIREKLPVAILICKTCGYVASFSWRKIVGP